MITTCEMGVRHWKGAIWMWWEIVNRANSVDVQKINIDAQPPVTD